MPQSTRQHSRGCLTFAINHAATALLLKRQFAGLRLLPLLLSVQAMELLWVALNFAGVERTTTSPIVEYVGDIQLAYMPFSHSILTMIGAGLFAWIAFLLAGRARLGAAIGVGVVSHLVLDLVTHNGDIAFAPASGSAHYGTYLYAAAPAAAFLLELGFGLFCWWIARGGRTLLAVILGFNLANASLFFKAVPGPESLLANRPTLIVTVILLQIVATLAAVGWAEARDRRGAVPAPQI